MKTKVVYVLVSTDKDIYLEQMWVSLFSLHHFHDDVTVEVATDEATAHRIQSPQYKEVSSMIDNIIAVPFDENVSGMERSRYLKTNIRQLVCGDFLFIDTDTIITGDLSEVDRLETNLGMVLDWHCALSARPNWQGIRKRIKKLFEIELDSNTNYFNSGVIYSKDTSESHYFFDVWHKNWGKAKDKPNGMQDQQSLAVTVNEIGGVTELSGDFNCQPLASINYLTTAKIVHFFNTNWAPYPISPFFGKKFYMGIKTRGAISEADKASILTCRSQFVSPCLYVTGDDVIIWRSPTFKLMRALYNKNYFIYRLLNKMAKIMLKTTSPEKNRQHNSSSMGGGKISEANIVWLYVEELKYAA